jgi:gliding motility-associated-like protein
VTNTVNGCISTRTVNVEVDPAVPSAIGNAVRDVSCFGYTNGSVAISGVTGGTAPYLFSVDNQPFIPASAFNSLPPGDHSLRVQDANGCELETTFNVGEPAELIVNLGPDTTIRLGDAITLSLDNTVNYPDRVATTMLTPSSLDTIIANSFVPTYSLQYRFAVVDSNGCRADDTRMIIVDRTRRIFVPNIFDPNGAGGVNNLLTVFGGNDVKQIKSFKIFDRWGESIHEARSFLPGDLNVAWDGKINGKEANPAVFIYTVEVLFKDGETELFSGDVTLIRQ